MNQRAALLLCMESNSARAARATTASTAARATTSSVAAPAPTSTAAAPATTPSTPATERKKPSTAGPGKRTARPPTNATRPKAARKSNARRNNAARALASRDPRTHELVTAPRLIAFHVKARAGAPLPRESFLQLQAQTESATHETRQLNSRAAGSLLGGLVLPKCFHERPTGTLGISEDA